jgi:hypothetical protein
VRVGRVLRVPDKTAAAAEYPGKEVCGAGGQGFQSKLQLEFLRYKLQTKEQELSQLQLNWVKSKEAKTRPPVTDELQSLGTKRAWEAGGVTTGSAPSGQSQSKKRKFLALGKMRMVKSVGNDIKRAWNHFVKDFPEALKIAETYGAANCKGRDREGLDPDTGEGAQGQRL